MPVMNVVDMLRLLYVWSLKKDCEVWCMLQWDVKDPVASGTTIEGP